MILWGLPKKPCRLNMSESETPRVFEPSFAAEDKPEAPIAIEEKESIFSANVRSFHIDFYNRQDHYRGRITLLGSDLKRIFKGVDVAAIADFISQNVPPLPRENAVYAFFEDISLLQRGRVVRRDESLKAWKHFCINVRWNLPSAKVADALDEADNIYAMQAWILDEEHKHIVTNNAEGSTLKPGVSSYVISIAMVGLQPAKYFLKIQVVSPFSRIKESTGFYLRVER